MLRSLLLSAISFYRRRLSRRGPFACVRCTFEHQESCSAYGKRMLEEQDVHIALPRLVRRLTRCRRLSLYRLTGGGLGWGAGYHGVVEADDGVVALRRLDEMLRGDAECAAVRAAVRSAAGFVGAASRTGQVPPLTSRHEELPLIREAQSVHKGLSRRCRTRGVLTLIVAALSAALAACECPEAALAMAAAGTLPLLSALHSWRLCRRLDDLEVMAALDGPAG